VKCPSETTQVIPLVPGSEAISGAPGHQQDPRFLEGLSEGCDPEGETGGKGATDVQAGIGGLGTRTVEALE
jgi:hypothetical protein